jgi:hypothetical protein
MARCAHASSGRNIGGMNTYEVVQSSVGGVWGWTVRVTAPGWLPTLVGFYDDREKAQAEVDRLVALEAQPDLK